MLKNHRANESLIRDGFEIVTEFIDPHKLENILNKVKDYELNYLSKDIESLSGPFVTLFVAGYKNEQIIIAIDDFPEVKSVIEDVKVDIMQRFNASLIYAYEITIFKKKAGSPALQIHQDEWYHPFEMTDKHFEYFSYYFPLTKFNKASSGLGLCSVTNIDMAAKYRSKDIVSGQLYETPGNLGSEFPDLIEKIIYPDMNVGDLAIFEIRTPHDSKPHLFGDPRYALSIRVGITPPKIVNLDESRGNFVKLFRRIGKSAFFWMT